MAKCGRKFSARTLVLKEWAEKYGASFLTMRKYTQAEFEQMQRMEEHARATIFSTMRWEKENPGWITRMPRNTVNVKRTVPVVKNNRGHAEEIRINRALETANENGHRVRRMMELATKLRVA